MRTLLIAAALVLVSSAAPARGRGQSGLRQIREPAGVQRLPRQAGTAGGPRRSPSPNRPAPCAQCAPPLRRAAFIRCTPSRPHDEAMAGCGWSSRSRQGRAARRVGDRSGMRAAAASKLFLQAFPNLRPFFAKLFQRFLWPFCGISRGCKAPSPHFHEFPNFLAREAPGSRSRAAPRRRGRPSRAAAEPPDSESPSERIVRGT